MLTVRRCFYKDFFEVRAQCCEWPHDPSARVPVRSCLRTEPNPLTMPMRGACVPVQTEGEPALTSIFCALEAAPFEAFARDGRVAFAAPRTLAQGAESCELRLSKVEGARHPFLSWASQGG